MALVGLPQSWQSNFSTSSPLLSRDFRLTRAFCHLLYRLAAAGTSIPLLPLIISGLDPNLHLRKVMVVHR
jgi:hypothetical protein